MNESDSDKNEGKEQLVNQRLLLCTSVNIVLKAKLCVKREIFLDVMVEILLTFM